ncbi:MAG: DUF4105 domain-containing protein [Lachnoclostridium sp.]|nr:DUF4105 domain-containing protein [Lachnoclostridium sp.]
MKIRFLTYIVALLLTALSCAAAPVYEFSFLTCYPGPIIYELEGHSGLRVIVTDPEIPDFQSDFVLDWGNFDFDTPNFVYRFTKGETDYSIGMRDTDRFLRSFSREGRKVTEQKLLLSEQEKEALANLLSENLQPENQVYRYNYVKDNCATRIVDILEKSVCDSLSLAPSGLGVDNFRDAMRLYHRNYPWYQFGIDLALGASLDSPVADRAMAFSPEALERMIAGARRSDGRLIAAPPVALNHIESSAIESPTPWYLTPMAVAMAILLLSAAFTIRDLCRGRVTKWWDAVLYGIFGVMGLILTFLIFISVHEATSPNWLYLWLNPLCFIVTACIWVKKLGKLVICYQFINFVLLLALLVILITGIQQPNAAFYPLILADMMRSVSYIYLNKCNSVTRQI